VLTPRRACGGSRCAAALTRVALAANARSHRRVFVIPASEALDPRVTPRATRISSLRPVSTKLARHQSWQVQVTHQLDLVVEREKPRTMGIPEQLPWNRVQMHDVAVGGSGRGANTHAKLAGTSASRPRHRWYDR